MYSYGTAMAFAQQTPVDFGKQCRVPRISDGRPLTRRRGVLARLDSIERPAPSASCHTHGARKTLFSSQPARRSAMTCYQMRDSSVASTIDFLTAESACGAFPSIRRNQVNHSGNGIAVCPQGSVVWMRFV